MIERCAALYMYLTCLVCMHLRFITVEKDFNLASGSVHICVYFTYDIHNSHNIDFMSF